MKRRPGARPWQPLPAQPVAGGREGSGVQGLLLQVPTVRALAQAELTLPPEEESGAERHLSLVT